MRFSHLFLDVELLLGDVEVEARDGEEQLKLQGSVVVEGLSVTPAFLQGGRGENAVSRQPRRADCGLESPAKSSKKYQKRDKVYSNVAKMLSFSPFYT